MMGGLDDNMRVGNAFGNKKKKQIGPSNGMMGLLDNNMRVGNAVKKSKTKNRTFKWYDGWTRQ